MLDSDLAALYGVETRVLNQAVRRNSERFPKDFMFELARSEIRNISQIVICSGSSTGLKHAKRVSAFTENGVAMLSGVLNSHRAIQANVQIMRAFTRLRREIASHEALRRRLSLLERRYDARFGEVFEAIRELMEPPVRRKRRIGFHV